VKPKTKNPLGLSASGPMSTFSSYLLGTTQRARHVAVMMVTVRPQMIGKAHLPKAELKQAAPLRQSGRGVKK
jgi:hypothetical protein